jgi:hypothetical protein
MKGSFAEKMRKLRGARVTIGTTCETPPIDPIRATRLSFSGDDWPQAQATQEGEVIPGRQLQLSIPALGIAAALALAAGPFLGAGTTPQEILPISDNDAITRLLSVRAWLAGQGWFDMTLPQVMPPEGLSLHWSRYIDLALAAIILAASQVVSPQAAEAVALLLWPAALLTCLILLSARTAARLFGPVAGGVAALAVATWPVTRSLYFGPGRIDHHNVQIVLLLLVLLSLTGAGRPLWRGAAGGLAAAMSLAVGLENLLPIGVAGLVLFWRLWRGVPGSAARLGAFALTMAFGALLLFAGQTAPTEWTRARCDELAPPVLAVLAVAAGTSLAAIAAARRLDGAAHAAGLATLLALGGALALYVMAPCASGPYGALPEVLRSAISTRIVEAAPAHVFAIRGLPIFYINLLPAYLVVVLATLVWLRARRSGRGRAAEEAAGLFLLFGWIGVAASLYQIRLLVLAAPVIPLLTGYLIGALFEARRARRGATGPALRLMAGVASTLLLPWLSLAAIILASLAPSAAGPAPRFDPDDCRSTSVLQSLAALPPGRVLTYTNLGPAVLLLTDHSVFAAPYHRSAEALGIGILPFEADRETLFAALDRSGADYLVLCRTALRGAALPYAVQLAGGAEDARLSPVDGVDEALRVLKVQP